jgi:hypothetical protein
MVAHTTLEGHSDEPTLDLGTPELPPDRPWRRALRTALLIWIASRAGLAALTAVAWIGEEQPRLNPQAAAYKWATQFDSVYFLTIAGHGYQHRPEAAFFPTYPLLIRALTPIIPPWVAALVIANVALLAALAVLHRLTEHEFGAAAAGRASFYLVAFPTGFFLTAAYNESLFIAVLLASVYCLRRGHWWRAGAFGAIAASTRAAGILLVLAFFFEYRRRNGRVLPACLVPLGLLAVMAVNYLALRDPLAFAHAQREHWGRHPDWPWLPIREATLDLAVNPFSEIWVHNALEVSVVALALVTTAAMAWFVRRDQLVFPLIALAITAYITSFPTMFKHDIPYPLLSSSRLGLELFPVFMMLGVAGRRPFVDRLLLAVFLPVQGILAARFLHSGWVA